MLFLSSVSVWFWRAFFGFLRAEESGDDLFLCFF